MIRLHILTEGFVATNVRAMLFPLIVWRRALRARGIDWRIFHTAEPAMFDCDVLVVESNVHGKRWRDQTDAILAEFDAFSARVDRLFYLDSSDSTALLHPEVLPLVDRYFKGQLLADRNAYAAAHYGRRLFTDFAHERFGVADAEPDRATPVTDPALRARLAVWWNSALADWSPRGRYTMELYARAPLPLWLGFPPRATDPRLDRPVPVSCRMGVNYARDTVAWHRRMASEKLQRWAPANRVSHREYIRELRAARLVVSPFGWGEINYKDYETFLAGSTLVKPDMSHLETWPALYEAGRTYAAYDWSGDDIVATIETLLDDSQKAASIAEAGQENYRSRFTGPAAIDMFANHLHGLLTRAPAESAA